MIAYFNLATGELGTLSAGSSHSITPAGNGWYRCSVTGANAGLSSRWGCFPAISNGYTLTPAAIGNGVHVWGPQLEAGTFPTSYIPTVASSRTRAADVASMTGANFSSWYNQNEGTLYSHYTSLNKNQNIGMEVATIYGGGGYDPFIKLSQGYSSGFAEALIYQSGTYQALLQAAGTYYTGMPNRVAFVIKENNFAFAGNGGAVSTDTSGTLPQAIRMNLFEYDGGRYTGIIRRLAYYPVRLPDAQLQALTR